MGEHEQAGLEQVAMDARQAFTSPAFRQMPKPRRARDAYPKSISKAYVASFAEQAKEAFERHSPPADEYGVLTLASGAELTKLEWQVLAMAALIQHARNGQPVVTAQSAWGNALGVSQPRISGVLATLRRDGFLADTGAGYQPPTSGKPGRARRHRVTPKGMDAMRDVLADHPPGSLVASADADSAQVLGIEGKPPSPPAPVFCDLRAVTSKQRKAKPFKGFTPPGTSIHLRVNRYGKIEARWREMTIAGAEKERTASLARKGITTKLEAQGWARRKQAELDKAADRIKRQGFITANHSEAALQSELTNLIRDFREAGYPMMMDRPKAAELLGVNPNNLWKHTRNGTIPATRYGGGRGVLRYSLRDLATYILSNRTAKRGENIT